MQALPETHVLSPAELRALQMVLLDMLDEVDRICQKHGIRYCLDGGALIGAARDGRLLAWDDDLDVTMLRGEYQRFIAACAEDLDEEKYFWQDHHTDPAYRWGYGRLRRKNSEFVRAGQEHMQMQTGIFLDIFPRDNVPDSPLLRPFHRARCFLLRKALYAEAGRVTGKNALVRGWYRLLCFIPRDWAFRRLEALAARWNKAPTKLVRSLTFPVRGGKRYGYRRQWYEELGSIELEGRRYACPADLDGYLTWAYGDWHTPPPEGARHWHPCSAFRLPGGQSAEDILCGARVAR